MATNEPAAKNLADFYRLGPLDWDDVRGTLAYAVMTKGPGGATRWTF
jgi:hypothetical protein